MSKFFPVSPSPPYFFKCNSPKHLVLYCIFQGVKFMYDCVTGTQIEGSHGCIMADEMV